MRIASSAVFHLLLVLGGCGRTSDFSGPAPAGALRCALEHGLSAGYEVIEGREEDRFLRLAQRLPGPPAEERVVERTPGLGDVVLRNPADIPVENQIEVREAAGRLHITVLGINHAGVRVGPGSNAEDQARTILALCTANPPVPPATAG